MTGKKLHKALVEVCGAVENVKRDTKGQVGNTKYFYATIDAVLEVVQPLLKANGLALVQYVRGDCLIAELHHEDGEVWSFGEYNLGNFIDSQKRGSAITYGRRYQLCSIFGIAQEDDDGAAASNVKATASKSSVFSTKVDREKYEKRLIEQMESSPDIGELQAVWSDASPTLIGLRQSGNEDDQHCYAHLLKMKDMVKMSIMATSKA